ncbi:hypothetical protein ACP275_02G108800 [Erythranthe tilingii]
MELIPLFQSLITPDLALAFNIPNPHNTPPPQSTAISSQPNSSAEFDSPEMSGTAGGGGGGGDEPARTLKRPRMVWTPQLHKRFVDAIAHLRIKNAVPKTIMQLMSVDGFTRENPGGSNSPAALSASGMDAATNHLFASSPAPAHFLHTSRPNSDHYLPFVPIVAVAAAAMQPHPHPITPAPIQAFWESPPNGQFEQLPFLRANSLISFLL